MMMNIRKLGVVLIIIGFSLGYLTRSHSLATLEFLLFPLVSPKFMHYGLLGLALLLVVIGIGFLMLSFGKGNLKVFLLIGSSVGLLIGLNVFREMSIRCEPMVKIGEATTLTFVYYGVILGMAYGTMAGIIAVVAYHIIKRQ